MAIYIYVPNNVILKYKAKSEFQGETEKATVDKNHTELRSQKIKQLFFSRKFRDDFNNTVNKFDLKR